MNKGEIVDAVAGTVESKAAAGRAVDAVLGAIVEGLKKGESVTIVGFGTFAVKTRKARMGINPRTGEKIQIAESKSVGFKPSSALKGAL